MAVRDSSAEDRHVRSSVHSPDENMAQGARIHKPTIPAPCRNSNGANRRKPGTEKVVQDAKRFLLHRRAQIHRKAFFSDGVRLNGASRPIPRPASLPLVRSWGIIARRRGANSPPIHPWRMRGCPCQDQSKNQTQEHVTRLDEQTN